MICTSNYKSAKNENVVSISGDGGSLENFKGKTFKKLAPKKSFWQIWHNNIGVVDEIINNQYYLEEYYNLVLSNLDAKSIINELPEGAILLCYEASNEFCHRHIVSAWLEIELSISVPEIILENDNIVLVDKPLWIKESLLKLMN